MGIPDELILMKHKIPKFDILAILQQVIENGSLDKLNGTSPFFRKKLKERLNGRTNLLARWKK